MAEQAAGNRLVQKYEVGQFICKEGDDARDMFIIKAGKVDIIKEMGDDEMVLATLGKNDFVGEMALFGIDKRTASVKAVAQTEIIVVTKRMLETQFRKIPDWLVTMIKTIAKRIITTSKGVQTRFKVSAEWSILNTIKHISESYGTPTDLGSMMPLQIVRDELYYTLGISYEEIDIYLKRFGLVNILRILGGKGMLEIPNLNRMTTFIDYIYSKSPEGAKIKLDLESEAIKSFERIYKLMQR